MGSTPIAGTRIMESKESVIMNRNLAGLLPILLLVVIMYFLIFRPQKKKEKELNAMRAALKVGDSIVSIGGICGKVVRVKDDTVVIQVGADKVKFELTRWAISQVVSGKGSKLSKETDDEKSKSAARPRRLKKAEKEAVVDVEVEPATPENADEN